MKQPDSHNTYQALIETERERLLSDLNQVYGTLRLPDLAVAADSVEDFLFGTIADRLIERAELLFDCRRGVASQTLVDKTGQAYHLRMADHIRDIQTLLIAITPIGLHTTHWPRARRVRTEGFGRYRKIDFIISPAVRVKFDLLSALVAMIVETAYLWFKNQLIALALDERLSLARNLYKYIKNIFPSEKLRENLWFACVTEDVGFRLLEHDVARASFPLVDQHSKRYGYSTNRLVSEVLNTVLPRHKLLMQKAVSLKKCLDANLAEAKYKQEGSSYAAAMATLYGSDFFTMYPILTEGQICILALFPTPFRSSIEPLLDEHLGVLVEECKKSLSVVHRTLDLLREKSSSPRWTVAIGEMLGGFYKVVSAP